MEEKAIFVFARKDVEKSVRIEIGTVFQLFLGKLDGKFQCVKDTHRDCLNGQCAFYNNNHCTFKQLPCGADFGHATPSKAFIRLSD